MSGDAFCDKASPPPPNELLLKVGQAFCGYEPRASAIELNTVGINTNVLHERTLVIGSN